METTASANDLRSQSEIKRGTFVFPPPPRLCRSVDSSCSSSDSSNTPNGSNKCFSTANLNKKHSKRKAKRLPPIGVFWDIENCQVPKGRSAAAVTHMIRELFYEGYRESVFLVVCDVKKEQSQVVQDLNDAQVSLIHVSSQSKNAADEKLRQELRRFADTHPPPAAVVLISGDVNFAPDLNDLRYRKKLYVILIHNINAADALILCANETYSYSALTEALPKDIKPTALSTNQPVEIQVVNLPVNFECKLLRNRLKQLSDNCGGRVVHLSTDTGSATIRFSSLDTAIRAQRRMDGEDVFGNKIYTNQPTLVRNSSQKNFTGRRIKSTSEDVVATPVAGPYNGGAAPTLNQYLTPQAAYGPLDLTRFANCNSSSYSPLGACAQIDARQMDCGSQQQQQATYGPIQTDANAVGKFEGRKIKGNAQMMMDMAASANSANNSNYQYNKNGFSNEEFYCQPITFDGKVCCNGLSQSPNSSPVALTVSSIDSSLDSQEVKNRLINMFKQYVPVHSVTVSQHSQGPTTAVVRVCCMTDAQFAISKLHHHLLGNKRINISYAQANMPVDPQLLRTESFFLLQEVPSSSMPLFKFLSLLEKRIGCSVSVSEVNKLKDVCKIVDESSGRTVVLNPELRRSSPNSMNSGCVRDFAFCTVHCPNGISSRGWAEQDLPPLPNVFAKLQDFSEKVKIMIESHCGMLPLQTFAECYQAEFNEPLLNDEERGVPLEHFVTRVKNIELKTIGNNPTKFIIWIPETTESNATDETNSTSSSKCNSPPTVGSLHLLGRELVDLLRKAPKCQLPFNKFIPAYHHHFGRQCRVADYGYTKLIELFEAIPHIIQLIGEGAKKKIILSKPVQIRRFTSDLLRILKIQPFKQITSTDFPVVYEKQMGRPFNPMEYGLCCLDDLINEVNKITVVVTPLLDNNNDEDEDYDVSGNEFLIALPKREQTPEEKRRTKTFQLEVMELLRHAPNCSILFNKFVPAYHHHFGRQCKVSDYGFTKLIDLFEVIPQTVQIQTLACNDDEQERIVTLTQPLMLKVIREQIAKLLQKESHTLSVTLNVLSLLYLKEYGYALKPETYGCDNLMELICKLDGLDVEMTYVGYIVVLVDADAQRKQELRVWSCLATPPHSMAMGKFLADYRAKFGRTCYLNKLKKMENVVQIIESGTEEATIALAPFYVLAARIYRFLYEAGGYTNLSNFELLYFRRCGSELRPSDYGCASLVELLQKLAFLVVLRGKRNRKMVALNKNLTELNIQLPVGILNQSGAGGNGNGSAACGGNGASAAGGGSRGNGGNGSSGPDADNADDLQWPPPPPAHLINSNNNRWKLEPPKPDTPPANLSPAPWSNGLWNSPTVQNLNVTISIPLPIHGSGGEAVKNYNEMNGLVSPDKNLLPAHDYPSAPKASELPQPPSNLLIGLEPNTDDISVIDPESAIDRNKRKMRLAPQFNVQMS